MSLVNHIIIVNGHYATGEGTDLLRTIFGAYDARNLSKALVSFGNYQLQTEMFKNI